jgi:sulfur carrier protein
MRRPLEAPGPIAVKVEIALYATLSKYLPPGAQNRKAVIEAKAGATVREVMNQLGVPPDLPIMLLVNGRQAPDGTVLKDGETVSVFPPLAGGAALAWPPLAGGCAGGGSCSPVTGARPDLSSVLGSHPQPGRPRFAPRGRQSSAEEGPWPSG